MKTDTSERISRERASLLSCVGELLKRSVRRQIIANGVPESTFAKEQNDG